MADPMPMDKHPLIDRVARALSRVESDASWDLTDATADWDVDEWVRDEDREFWQRHATEAVAAVGEYLHDLAEQRPNLEQFSGVGNFLLLRDCDYRVDAAKAAEEAADVR